MYVFLFSSQQPPNANKQLSQFLQRAKALSLWRSIIRGSRRIADEKTRKETLDFAREEFRRNKNVTDIVSYSAIGY
jgi:hypothetical protein